MTTKARPIPPHGTSSRYRGDPRNGRWAPCRCTPCSDESRRRRKILELRAARGQDGRHDIEPVIAHIQRLMDNGWSLRHIEEAAGVNRRGMYNIRNRHQKTVNHETAARIFALRSATTPYLVDATGTRRRIQALVAIGWSMAAVDRKSGICDGTLGDIAAGRNLSITSHTRAAVASAYKQLVFRPGPSGWSRAFAAKRQWHGPLAWDDIDDPAAEPEATPAYKSADKYRRDPLRRAEIEHLYLLGESLPSIARQLGGNEKYIGDRLDDIIRERQARAEQERLAAKQRGAVQTEVAA